MYNLYIQCTNNYGHAIINTEYIYIKHNKKIPTLLHMCITCMTIVKLPHTNNMQLPN